MQRKRIKKAKKKRFLRNAGASVLAMILTVALVVGLVPSDALAAVSDGDTSTSYKASLGDDASTEYSGRIWTDKSVYVDDATFEVFGGGTETIEKVEGEDFLVAYSALGTSQVVSGRTQAPVDVVFIIDVSGSMSNNNSEMDNGLSRIANTVAAVNDSIEDLMAMNDYTRVAVVAFSDTAQVLLPLDRYSKVTNNNGTTYDYFTLNTTSAGGNNGNVDLYTRAIGVENGRISETDDVSGGTNIQMGLYTGMNILATEDSTTVDIEGQIVQRIPSVIMLSDGAPTYSSGSQRSGGSTTQSNWWAPLNNNNDGPGSSPYYGNGMKALMTGAYMKDAVNRNYQVTGTSAEATLYTVGMGISELDNYAQAGGGPGGGQEYYTGEQDLAYMTLNPGGNWDNENAMAEDIRDAWDEYTDGDTTNPVVQTNSNETYTITHPNTGYDIYDAEDEEHTALKELVDDYYDANSASGVTNVFEQIVSNISISALEVPTEVSSGDPVTDGYITYTDKLGKYTEVKDVKAIVYAGNVYTQKTVSPADGTRPTTYTFTAEVHSPVYGDQNLDDILITVTADAAGDETIEIKIPASVIPVRVNTVSLNADGTVDTHTNNGAYPARVIYSVSVRDNVYTTIGEGEDAVDVVNTEVVSSEYINANMNADGSVNFYSNLYTGNELTLVDKNGETVTRTVGDTTVTFEPSHTNPFYYMQEDIPIYTDEECTEPATTLDPDTTYYYKNVYYEGNVVVEESISRTGAQLSRTDIITKDGQVYRAKGSPRLNRILEFEGTKTDNATNTAADFYTPTFVYAEGSTSAYDGHFVVYLGNNGVLAKAAGGHLEISKSVTAADGLTAPTPEKGFEFTVDFNGEETLAGEYEYVVVDANEEVVGEGKVADGGKIYLNDGETATIKNLPAGTTYTVTETAVAGFITTPTGNEGTIAAGATVESEFVNRYEVEELQYPTEGGFIGKKVLDGRAWDNDSFTFLLTPYNDAPLPAGYPEGGVTITTATMIDADTYEAEFVFGDGTEEGNKITFTKPGVYRYTVVEQEPATAAPGLSYSRALYRIVITVVDNGDGTLSATSDIQKLYTDDANPLFTYNDQNEVVVEDETQDEIVFTNTYTAGSVTRVPVATKTYTDNSGEKPLVSGMFQFKLEAIGVVDASGNVVADSAAQVPMPDEAEGATSIITENEGHNVTFFPVTFTDDHIPEGQTSITYQYKMSEVIPSPAVTGMDYDETVYVVNITLSKTSGEALEVNAVYNNNPEIRIANFVNVYTPEPTTATIDGIKTIEGRDMKDGETFEFTLAPSASTGLATQNGAILVDGTTTEVSVSGGKDGVAETFSFGTFTFTKPGVYTFYINETAGNAGGMAYDSHTSTVTITVTDNAGKLEAVVDYSDSDKAHAEFVNTYTTTFDITTAVDLSGTKTLTGQSLEEGEFYFEVKDVNANTTVLKSNAANGSITFLEDVTYSAAGTYYYEIKEQIPSPGVKGMDYDETVYLVKVVVTDDGNGNLLASKPEISTDNGTTWTSETPVVFENEYVPEKEVITLPAFKKVISGDRNKALEAGEFEFVLSLESANPTDGILLPGETEADLNKGLSERTVTVGNNADGTISFGEFTFTKAGVYSILVKEVPGDVSGMTYSTQEIRVTLHVEDNSAGDLTVTVISETGEDTFTNTYKTTGTIDDITITKNLVGREWLDTDKFDFEVVIVDPATQAAVEAGDIVFPADENGIIELTLTKEQQSVTAPAITFNKAGTYKFRIHEVTEETADEKLIPGVTYDSDPRIVVATATDNGDGTLTVTWEVEGEKDLTFTNVYDTESTPIYGHEDLLVDKAFTGRPDNAWLDTDAFTFVLEAGDDKTQAAIDANEVELPEETTLVVTNANKDHAHFGDIIFHEEGEYVFVIKEVLPEEANGKNPYNGITYDLTERKVYVKVEDNNAGALVATKTVESDILTFENKYTTTEVTLEGATNLAVEKVLVGRDWFDSDEFTFKLEAASENAKEGVANGDIVLPENATGITITKAENGTAAFGDIVFKKTGVYGFNIVEVVPENADDNIAYDTHTLRVLVTVTDGNDGKLVASATALDSRTFTNTFTPDSVSIPLEGEKVLNGRTLENGEFRFHIEAITEDAPMPAQQTIVNGDVESASTVNFGAITYTEAGTYEYEITEIAGNLAGITYDAGKVAATVTVTYDAATGVLTPSVAYVKVGEGEGFTFVNKYDTTETDEVYISAKKEVTPVDGNTFTMNAGDFKFEIEPSQNNPASDPIKRGYVSNDAEGNVLFAEAAYTEAGTYVYTVHEAESGRGGIILDESVYTITVVVTDSVSEAKLYADVTIEKDGKEVDAITFNNGYDPSEATAIIHGHKVLNGGHKDLEAGEFTFKLSAVDGAPMPEKAEATNTETGLFQFGAITYQTAGTYEYRISEEKANEAGYTYDETIYTAVVTVTDDGNGVLTATVTVNGETMSSDKQLVVFENTYEPKSVSVEVKATKELSGREINDGEFKVALLDKDGEEVATAVNGGNAFVIKDDADLTFDKAGTYNFTLVEVDTKIAGVTTNPENVVYGVQVVVTDEKHDGQLDAVVNYIKNDAAIKDSEVVFKNEYKAAPTSIQLGAAKHLEGRSLVEGEFSFVLEDEDGNKMYASNTADGSITFEEIEYTEAGEYEYKIYEEHEDGKARPGVTYDETVYTVTVSVVDGKDGYLTATSSVEDEPIEFNNAYEADSTSIALTAVKKLVGRDLEKGEFKFVLEDQDGNKIYATNAADGTITFEEIEYTEVGRHVYKMYEEVGELEDVTYDDTVYTIVVTVEDDLEGSLNAAADKEGKKVVFTNTYEEPEVPEKPEGPVDTGDDANMILWAVVMFAAAGIVVVTLVKRRRA